MLKEKILAELAKKYPGLSKNFLGLIAAQMATKVTEESGIEAAIAELDNAPIPIETLAAEFQKEGDRRVTEAMKPKPPKTEDKPKPNQQDPQDDTATLLRTLLQKVERLESEKVKGSIQSRLKDKLKDVPEDFYSEWSLPEADEEFEPFAEKIQSKWNKFKDDQVAAGLMTSSKPANATAAGDAKAVDADIDGWAKAKATAAGAEKK